MPVANLLAKYGVPLKSPQDTRPFPKLSDALLSPLDALGRFSPDAAFAANFLVPGAPKLTPAISVKGKVFAEGPTHGQAWNKWRQQTGIDAHQADAIYNSGAIIDGYTTPEGKFLNRQEAERYLGMPGTHAGLESHDIPVAK